MKKIFTILILTTFLNGFCQTNKTYEIAKYLSSTVTIFLDDNTKAGSGFIIDNGKIVTNLHVIEGSKSGYVIINGTYTRHEIDGYFDYDNKTDLAILSVPTIEGKPLIISNEKPKAGDKIFAFENPLISSKTILEGNINYISNSTTNGIIKTSIPLNFGNSGGALINSRGEVVGVVTGGIISDIENYKAGYAADATFLKNLLDKKNNTKKDLNLKEGVYHYLNESQLKINEKNYSGAILELNKAIEICPELYILYYNRGNLKAKLFDYEGSILDCNKALKIIPNFALAYYVRGLSKMNLKDNIGALNDFNKSIEIDNVFAGSYNSRGIVKAQLKDIVGGIKDCDISIKLEPNNYLFYIGRGFIKVFNEYKAEGCNDFQKAKELGFNDAQMLINKFCNK